MKFFFVMSSLSCFILMQGCVATVRPRGFPIIVKSSGKVHRHHHHHHYHRGGHRKVIRIYR